MTGSRKRSIALCALLLSWACGGGEPSVGGISLTAGATLLEPLEHGLVLRTASTNLPADVGAGLRDIVHSRSLEIAPGEWEKVEGFPPFAARERSAGRKEVYYWRVRPALRLDEQARFGVRRFEFSGRPLKPLTGVRNDFNRSRSDFWHDDTTDSYFHWNRERGELHAVSIERPEHLSFRYPIDPTRADGRVEAGPEGEIRFASQLAVHGVLDEVKREVLFAPAPTTIEWGIDHLTATTLEFVIAVQDVGFRESGGQLDVAANTGDGVLFAVDRVDASGTVELWSRHVATFGAFLEVSVDLGEAPDSPFVLRLRTETAGNDAFDYALWGDLRFGVEDPPAPSRPHVFLVDVDTLRADRLGCYGCDRPTSPRIDAWAEDATIYEDVTASSNWTLPSTTSILTGLSVHQHGVVSAGLHLAAEHRPLALVLKEAGYLTRARTDGGFVAADFGFDVGFDVYDGRSGSINDWDEVLRELESRSSSRPWFWFLQTYRVHAPNEDSPRFDADLSTYDGPYKREPMRRVVLEAKRRRGQPLPGDEDWRYIRAVYDAAIWEMDRKVGAFLEGLERVLQDEDYLVVFTSDHGEEFDEHGDFGHGSSMYVEQLRVPLMVRYPGGEPRGRFAAPVSSLDIVPTVLDVLELPVPDHLIGRSLLAPLVQHRVRSALREELHPCVSVDYEGWKLVQPDAARFSEGAQLYRVESDPGEQDDVSADHPERVELLRELYTRHLEAQERTTVLRKGGTLRPEVVQELEALGYLGDE